MTDPVAAAALALPVAALEQGQIVPVDLDLRELARLRHPAARWWWGERVIDGRNGAYCYLCDQLIATWARSWPTPEAAMIVVREHRLLHGAGIIPHLGHDTAGTSPAGEAAPTEVRE